MCSRHEIDKYLEEPTTTNHTPETDFDANQTRRIKVHGFVMLKGLNDGDILDAVDFQDGTTGFYKRNSATQLFRHYTDSVNCWVSDNASRLNRIEVI